MGTAFLGYKSESCRHPDSCFLNAIKTAVNSLKYGLCIEAGREIIRLVLLLIRKRNPKEALASLFTASFDRIRIPMFLLINSLTLRGGHCLIKYLRSKNDVWNSLSAGILCGVLSMPFLKHSQWYLVLSLLAARIVDALYRIAIARGILKEENSNIHFYVMFALGNMINAYGFFIEGDLVESDMKSLYTRMAALDPKENQWLRSSLAYKKATM